MYLLLCSRPEASVNGIYTYAYLHVFTCVYMRLHYMRTYACKRELYIVLRGMKTYELEQKPNKPPQL